MRALIYLLFGLVACNVAYGLEDDFVRLLWNKFKDTHGKKYLGAEHEMRFGIFKKNVELIEEHNRNFTAGLTTYTLGINPFADMTFTEFSQKMLGTHLNFTYDKNATSSRFVRLSKKIKLPESIDWREEGAVTPVKNQGECGSCWAFSTTGSLEGAHFRLTGKLVSLSEQQLVDCSGKYHNNGCDGGLMDNAFQYVKDIGGLDTEDSYPYHARKEKCHFNKNTIGSTCSGFADIESGNEEALKEAVATNGPVSVAIDVTEEKFMLYKDGVFVDPTCKNDADNLNHGVLVVGYGSATSNKNGKNENQGYWIVKNSWSEKWGESGYIRMARDLKNMCGVATAASYPLVKNESF